MVLFNERRETAEWHIHSGAIRNTGLAKPFY